MSHAHMSNEDIILSAKNIYLSRLFASTTLLPSLPPLSVAFLKELTKTLDIATTFVFYDSILIINTGRPLAFSPRNVP
jgi:hypothetical protein